MQQLSPRRLRLYLSLLGLGLLLAAGLAARLGALSLSTAEFLDFALGRGQLAGPEAALHRAVFWQIRLPRVGLAMGVGAALAVGGTLLQALFRNPLVEPGLVGASAGAALGAAAVFVLGNTLSWVSGPVLGALVLPAAAFAGALGATALVYRLAGPADRPAEGLLLAGIAVNALATAGTGVLAYVARDPQARSITFWSLGSLSGADWPTAAVVLGVAGLGTALALRLAAPLDALQLGLAEAAYLGVRARRVQRRVLLLTTLLVAVATAAVGVIGFVGLVVPHALRLLGVRRQRPLLGAGALLGALLLLLADTAARTVTAPAELPVGVLTAFVGAPVFLALLRAGRRAGW